MRIVIGLWAVCVSLLLAACASSSGALSTAPPANVPTTASAYRIGVDDVVQVSVWRSPELSITAPVRPDGNITVPLVGDVMAAGRLPDEVAKDREPQVTVILTELRRHGNLSPVRVTGAVRTPVSIPYRQGMTVLDAVLAAGGVTEFAAPGRSGLYRRNGQETQSYAVKLDRILDNGDLATNYPVAPGDVITVPERAL